MTMVRGGCDIGSLNILRKKKKVSLGHKLMFCTLWGTFTCVTFCVGKKSVRKIC